MNKQEFIDELRSKLQGLPETELNERVSFYEEMIADRMEDGMTESEAVEQIGDPDKIVETIMSEIPLSRLVKHKASGKKLSVAAIVLLILGFPLWFPLVIALTAIILSLYITIWCVAIVLYCIDLSLAVSSIASLIAVPVLFIHGQAVEGFLGIGACLVCAALAVLMFIASVAVTKAFIKLGKYMVLGIKKMFVGKE